MKKNSIFEKYINNNKNDIIIYLIVLIISSIILLIIAKKTKFFYIMFLDIFIINSFIFKVNTGFILKRIENYVYCNNIHNKIGKIEYWNESNYFLTEKYIILAEKKEINIISYNDIKYMYYKNDIHLNQISYIDRELYIVLNNRKKYKFLVNSTLLTNEKSKDISAYLMDKNNTIKMLDNETDI